MRLPLFVVINVGCLECGEETVALGAYTSLEDAQRDHPKAQVPPTNWRYGFWRGSAMLVVLECDLKGEMPLPEPRSAFEASP